MKNTDTFMNTLKNKFELTYSNINKNINKNKNNIDISNLKEINLTKQGE